MADKEVVGWGGDGRADAAGRERSAVCFIVFFHVCNRLTFVQLKTVNTWMTYPANIGTLAKPDVLANPGTSGQTTKIMEKAVCVEKCHASIVCRNKPAIN